MARTRAVHLLVAWAQRLLAFASVAAVGAVASVAAMVAPATPGPAAAPGSAPRERIRLHFGLGAATRIDDLEVRWPSGPVQRLAPAAVTVNRIYRVEKGKAVELLQLSPVSGTAR